MVIRAIDVDPELLQRSADAAMHASEQAEIHIAAEIKGVIPELMDTLTPDGPYAYAIKPELNPDGSVTIPIARTRGDIEKWYKLTRGASDLLPGWPILEIRGEWYLFQEAVTRGRAKGGDTIHEAETIAIFPSTSGTGITGELVWFKMRRDALGVAADPVVPSGDVVEMRKRGLEQHDAYLTALRAADAEGVAAAVADGGQAAIRDYVAASGSLIGLRDRDEHRTYYRALFDTYELSSVDLLHRVVQDWYIFAEIRVNASPRAEGRPCSFRIAEFCVLANDGRFIGRVGHGTDPA